MKRPVLFNTTKYRSAVFVPAAGNYMYHNERLTLITLARL
jgi:hypothetical protein